MQGSHRFKFGSGTVQLLLLSISLVSTNAAIGQETTEPPAQDSNEAPLAVRIDSTRATSVQASVKITGHLMTPSAAGIRKWDLNSNGTFDYVQRQFPTELSGPLALRAVRQYSNASTETQVGKQHTTKSSLPKAQALIHFRGSDSGLQAAPTVRQLTRRQHDLLQMPCDPLPCSGLLPSRDVTVGDKWNCNDWVLPRLTGLEAITEQTLTCTLVSRNDNQATVGFEGTASGAVAGSAGSVSLKGTLVLDVVSQLVTSLNCDITEKRSAGPVSPGLDVNVDLEWSQAVTDSTELPVEMDESLFAKRFRLPTPWRIEFSHSSDWHVFNQTDSVMMLRQIRDGALISQCNISKGVVMPPGQHTSDADFLADINADIPAGGGSVIAEETIRDDNRWRVRHVQTRGSISDVEIIRDCYLCSAASGEQFSLMFSHSAGDDKVFGDEADSWLNSLRLTRRRPALPFR